MDDTEAVQAMKDRRQMKRGAAHPVSLTLDLLLGQLGWNRTFAEHFVQPYCECGWESDYGWHLCGHAEDLGITEHG